jgi:hypothetical protein
MNCVVCNSAEYYEDDTGFRYCAQCHTQSQGYVAESFELDDGMMGMTGRLKTMRSKKAKTETVDKHGRHRFRGPGLDLLGFLDLFQTALKLLAERVAAAASLEGFERDEYMSGLKVFWNKYLVKWQQSGCDMMEHMFADESDGADNKAKQLDLKCFDFVEPSAESTGKNEPRANRHPLYPSKPLILGLIYLQFRRMRLPFVHADIIRWCENGAIPYNTLWEHLPPSKRAPCNMSQRKVFKARHTAGLTLTPSNLLFHMCAIARSIDVTIPPLNAALVAMHVMCALGLPAIVWERYTQIISHVRLTCYEEVSAMIGDKINAVNAYEVNDNDDSSESNDNGEEDAPAKDDNDTSTKKPFKPKLVKRPEELLPVEKPSRYATIALPWANLDLLDRQHPEDVLAAIIVAVRFCPAWEQWNIMKQLPAAASHGLYQRALALQTQHQATADDQLHISRQQSGSNLLLPVDVCELDKYYSRHELPALMRTFRESMDVYGRFDIYARSTVGSYYNRVCRDLLSHLTQEGYAASRADNVENGPTVPRTQSQQQLFPQTMSQTPFSQSLLSPTYSQSPFRQTQKSYSPTNLRTNARSSTPLNLTQTTGVPLQQRPHLVDDGVRSKLGVYINDEPFSSIPCLPNSWEMIHQRSYFNPFAPTATSTTMTEDDSDCISFSGLLVPPISRSEYLDHNNHNSSKHKLTGMGDNDKANTILLDDLFPNSVMPADNNIVLHSSLQMRPNDPAYSLGNNARSMGSTMEAETYAYTLYPKHVPSQGPITGAGIGGVSDDFGVMGSITDLRYTALIERAAKYMYMDPALLHMLVQEIDDKIFMCSTANREERLSHWREWHKDDKKIKKKAKRAKRNREKEKGKDKGSDKSVSKEDVEKENKPKKKKKMGRPRKDDGVPKPAKYIMDRTIHGLASATKTEMRGCKRKRHVATAEPQDTDSEAANEKSSTRRLSSADKKVGPFVQEDRPFDYEQMPSGSKRMKLPPQFSAYASANRKRKAVLVPNSNEDSDDGASEGSDSEDDDGENEDDDHNGSVQQRTPKSTASVATGSDRPATSDSDSSFNITSESDDDY